MPKIIHRTIDNRCYHALLQAGVQPLLARIYAARGIRSAEQLNKALSAITPPTQLKNVDEMALILADAIEQHKRLLIVADYDADGATACAVGIRALRAFGAIVDYIVPNRFEYGYGLTPEIVHIAAQRRPDYLITVDNGIASIDGVAAAKQLGIEVLITDHHLPGDALPEARCIINPNQDGCGFPSKHLAGVGVIFYLMLALRAELRRRGAFTKQAEPNLAALLDIVALGTIADLVKLDDNNRILVHQGLERMRNGRAHAGIAALFNTARRDIRKASVYDLGFVLGPRLNAAGRLEDMSLGIECLITDDASYAQTIAQRLDALNQERRNIEMEMHDSALDAIEALQISDSYTLCLVDASWHQGVIGILASRLKEKYHRPVIAFARGNDGLLKGSGRSISALHLRDALDLVSKRNSNVLLKFGGHAAAAGVLIREDDFELFAELFEQVVRAVLSPAELEQIIETDGVLNTEEMNLRSALLLGEQVWGQGFPHPGFSDVFQVSNQRIVGEKHLKLKLSKDGRNFDAILFSANTPLPNRIEAVYRTTVNEFNGTQALELCLDYWQAR